jgi:hypothetical protein
MSQARFQKRLREKARQEKQAAKRARRAERAEAGDDEASDDEGVPAEPQDVVIAKLAKLHQAFDDEQIGFDEFEEQKQELMAQLMVD